MSKPRINADGTISYPKRGKPPTAPDGYEPDPGDPFKFIPKAVKCRFRLRKPFVMPCGKVTMIYVCNSKDCVVFNERIEYQDCIGCEHKESPGPE